MVNMVFNKSLNIIYEDSDIGSIEEKIERGCDILYVLNKDGKYLGCITRREVALSLQKKRLVVNDKSTKLECGADEEKRVKELFRNNHCIQNIPVVDKNGLLLYEYIREISNENFDSMQYWEERYKSGGNSGIGSYNRLAEFKAQVLNDFIKENNVNSLIEWGVGDGNQLSLLQVSSYVGYDVSKTALQICKEKFLNDNSKEFRYYDGSIIDNAGIYDMAISLDVIYHLVEDNKFSNYMHNLFYSSDRYVCIYSSDYEAKQKEEHVKRRKFTEYVKDKFREWTLISVIKNPYFYDGSGESNTSNSNFYFYKRCKQ